MGGIASSRQSRIVTEAEHALWSRTKIHLWILASPRGARGRAPSLPFNVKKPLLPFSYFIALRYLRPKRTFLSVITLISIIGVVLGISVLIIVISVMTGFERELERKVIGFDAHITISPEPNTFS